MRNNESAVPRDLGDGLLLRRATAADSDALATFNADVHREDGEPDAHVGAWTRDMLSGSQPGISPDDFTVVEETATGRIVSTMCLISQEWTYRGIPFGVGRVELVGTAPEYRRRGLVRAQMDAMHAWSAARGEQVQGITGIPWYYRQFGYEMGLELDGSRYLALADVPKPAAGATEPYHVRGATLADIPVLQRLYERGMARSEIACPRTEEQWRYELTGKSETNGTRLAFGVIETARGEAVGFLAYNSLLWGTNLSTRLYELVPDVSWLMVTPSILRFLRATGARYAEASDKSFDTLQFACGSAHPFYRTLPAKLHGGRRTYAWYVRVADWENFLRHITPALEARLAASIAAGHTGTLRLNFYRSGLRLILTDGRIAAIERWTPTAEERGDAAFPDLTFLQLLFGYRSLDALNLAFADCVVRTEDARALLAILFPPHPSDVWPIE